MKLLSNYYNDLFIRSDHNFGFSVDDDLPSSPYIYFQRFYEKSPKNYMFGTDKYPVYLGGYVKKLKENGFFSLHLKHQVPPYIEMLTPTILSLELYDGTKLDKINLMVGEYYIRNISIPKTYILPYNSGNDDEIYCWVEFDCSITEKMVKASPPNSKTNSKLLHPK